MLTGPPRGGSPACPDFWVVGVDLKAKLLHLDQVHARELEVTSKGPGFQKELELGRDGI